MLDLIRLIFGLVVDLFQSRAALEAEVLVLRQQSMFCRLANNLLKKANLFDVAALCQQRRQHMAEAIAKARPRLANARANHSPCRHARAQRPTVQCRYRQNCLGLEAAGADEDTARLVSSIVLYFEEHRRVRVEQAEVLALTAVMNLIALNLSRRAGQGAPP